MYTLCTSTTLNVEQTLSFKRAQLKNVLELKRFTKVL